MRNDLSPRMVPTLRHEVRITQRMTQYFQLLQATRQELSHHADAALADNPMLELVDDTLDDGERAERLRERPPAEAASGQVDWSAWTHEAPVTRGSTGGRETDELPGLEATLTRLESLADALRAQLDLARFDEGERRVGLLVIGNLDDDGYLREPTIADIAIEAGVDVADAEAVLARVQRFDPVGVAARGLVECLIIQAEERGEDDPVVRALIERHLASLAGRRLGSIATDLGVSVDEVEEAAAVVASLDPRPGRAIVPEAPHYVTPDVSIERVGAAFFVVPGDDGLPRMRVSRVDRAALARAGAAASYVQKKLDAAAFFLSCIQQRRLTLRRIAESILEMQRAFFERGDGAALRPLVMRDVARDIGVHESTVSRATRDKFLGTPVGTYPFKFFFVNGIEGRDREDVSSTGVKEAVRALIRGENPRRPLSDQQIVALLGHRGIVIARRTIAKYRDLMHIPPALKRRGLGSSSAA